MKFVPRNNFPLGCTAAQFHRRGNTTKVTVVGHSSLDKFQAACISQITTEPTTFLLSLVPRPIFR